MFRRFPLPALAAASLHFACTPAPQPPPASLFASDGGTSADAGTPACATTGAATGEEWERCLPEWNEARAVATDSEGNVYVAGVLVDHFDVGDVHLTAGAMSDPLLLKYSPHGELLWARQIRTPGGLGVVQRQGFDREGIDRVAVLADGSVMVAGVFQQTADFGDGVTIHQLPDPGGADHDYDINDGFVARYDAEGHAKWAKVIGAAWQVEQFDALASDGHGGALLGGHAAFGEGSVTFDDVHLEGVGHWLEDGTDDWVRDVPGEIKSTFVGPDGDFVTFGYLQRPADPRTNGTPHYGLTRWSRSGARQWHYDIPYPFWAIEPAAAAIDGDQVVLVAGIGTNQQANIGGHTYLWSDAAALIVRFDASGQVVSVFPYRAPRRLDPWEATLDVVPQGLVFHSRAGLFQLTNDGHERADSTPPGDLAGTLAPGNHFVVLRSNPNTHRTLVAKVALAP